MRDVITPERLAERVCRTLNVPAKDNAESLGEMLRAALSETRDRAIAAAKAVCLDIAEDEAERCRAAQGRRWRSKRHSPLLHASGSGTSKCGDSGQGGVRARPKRRVGHTANRRQTSQPGQAGRERVAMDANRAEPD